MAEVIHGPQDKYVKKLKKALDLYERENPGATAMLYRQNVASIRIRIVDSRFAKMDIGDRHDKVWDFLASHVDEDTMQEVSVLLLLSKGEQNSSFMNFEFNHPVPSGF